MAAYTVEDIELIRAKSGISYQEAVSLLDYHNGNVARALVDLERNGRIKAQADRPDATAGAQKKTSGRSGVADLVSKLYRARLKITKDNTTVVNLSALFGIAALIFSPHMVIAGAIASLVLGYKFAFVKDDAEFRGENLERMVRSAADNVRNSVSDFARGFQEGAQPGSKGTAAQAHPYAPSGTAHAGATAADKQEGSFYASHNAASYRASVPTINVPHVNVPNTPTAPTINIPVQVEGQDGSVTVQGDSEGFTSATID